MAFERPVAPASSPLRSDGQPAGAQALVRTMQQILDEGPLPPEHKGGRERMRGDARNGLDRVDRGAAGTAQIRPARRSAIAARGRAAAGSARRGPGGRQLLRHAHRAMPRVRARGSLTAARSCSLSLRRRPAIGGELRVQLVLRQVVGEVAQRGETHAEHDFQRIGIAKAGCAECRKRFVGNSAARGDYRPREHGHGLEARVRHRLLGANRLDDAAARAVPSSVQPRCVPPRRNRSHGYRRP